MANTTEMVFIIDKSGSMSGLESDTTAGFLKTGRKAFGNGAWSKDIQSDTKTRKAKA